MKLQLVLRLSETSGGDESSLLPVSEGLLICGEAAAAPGAPPEGAAVHLRRLWPRVWPSVAAEGAHALSHRREAVPVRHLHEALLRAQSAEEASGDPQQGGVQRRHR